MGDAEGAYEQNGGGKGIQEGSQEVAFRTISRSNNRALAVPCYRRGMRYRVGREERENERGGALSSPWCFPDAGGYLMSHLRTNLRIWLNTAKALS